MRRRLVTAVLLIAAAFAWRLNSVWAQHEGHGGMSMPSMPVNREAEAREDAEARRHKLERLQEKISVIEEELEKTDIAPKKRTRLQKKLDKLYEKKNRLLGVPETRVEESVAISTQTAVSAYACPMGDYSGPATKDGRCPKCGMALKQK